MDNLTTEGWEQARRPIASLISKSEKAQRKLIEGTWQHTMLKKNLKALHIASALMNQEIDATDKFARDDLQDALRALVAMMSRTKMALAKFSSRTPQHTLQRNRLAALRLAKALAKAELDNRAS